MADRHLFILENREKIFGGGFKQFFMTDAVEGVRLHTANVTDARWLFAVGLNLIHDGLPGAMQKRRVGGGEIGAGNLQIQRGLSVRIVLGLDKLPGFVGVSGVKTGAFAGHGVHAIKPSTSAAPTD
jgi:hypothetical protein